VKRDFDLLMVWKIKQKQREKFKMTNFLQTLNSSFTREKGKEKKNKTLQNTHESFCSQKRKDTQHLKHAQNALSRKKR